MIKQEFIKIIKSRKSWFIWLVFMAFAVGDSIYAYVNSGENGMFYNVHPAFISTLSAQTNAIERIGIFWIIPIYIILFYVDKYAPEKKLGLTNVYLTKIGKKKFFFYKMCSSFLSAFVFFAIPFLTNFLLNCILLRGGYDFFCMQDFSPEDLGFALNYSITHPYSIYLCYICSASMVYGFLSIMCMSISMIFDDNRLTYIISFAIWMALYTIPINSVYIAIQPFIEPGYMAGIFGFLKFFAIVVFFFVIAYIKMVVKKDEI